MPIENSGRLDTIEYLDDKLSVVVAKQSRFLSWFIYPTLDLEGEAFESVQGVIRSTCGHLGSGSRFCKDNNEDNNEHFSSKHFDS
jgi:hypothetical protein